VCLPPFLGEHAGSPLPLSASYEKKKWGKTLVLFLSQFAKNQGNPLNQVNQG
jgi:hypothetical protein